ncbi:MULTISPECIES: hypothetical protein [unclassified Halomonas]|uniref:hypothetical protein n=1 Tax=unclassified Halomonas TaxID=2609666 RepID=UPI002887BCAB|nr:MULTISPECIES: hypothetical protein [unclassified Halomonas]MDT0501623.1 hypothetical protein [Halomonas sp. PAR7]MDT0511020.1 hypothetical protein [Halomonas sp. LES1]MDT0592463.1 hypothetical protein [Halomonas sp. PAR8]
MAASSFAMIFLGFCVAAFYLTSKVECLYDENFFGYCVTIFHYHMNGFSEYYGENLRGHLFAGYISLGAFLLSLKAFIIISMKHNVYDSDAYKELHGKKIRGRNISPEQSRRERYAPLQQLSDFIYYAIVFSLVAAIAQVSIGLIESIYATLFCLWLVIFATFLLFNCLRIIKQNLDVWLTH